MANLITLWRGWIRADRGKWQKTDATAERWQECFHLLLAVEVRGRNIERRAVPEGEHPKRWRGTS